MWGTPKRKTSSETNKTSGNRPGRKSNTRSCSTAANDLVLYAPTANRLIMIHQMKIRKAARSAETGVTRRVHLLNLMICSSAMKVCDTHIGPIPIYNMQICAFLLDFQTQNNAACLVKPFLEV